MAVDHPRVAVLASLALEAGRVGAGHLRLGHAEERAHVAGDKWREPRRLLLGRPGQSQDLAVARVGRLAAEGELAPVAAADLLVQEGVGEEALARPARLRADVWRPQPGLPGPPAHVGDLILRGVVAAGERRLVGVDVLVHERRVALAQCPDRGCQGRSGGVGHQRCVYLKGARGTLAGMSGYTKTNLRAVENMAPRFGMPSEIHECRP